MPLASSRSSTEKASSARLSLPLTIDSSTRVTRTKANRRRASLRSKRDPSPAGSRGEKENTAPQSPGPTPYWKVAAEREGVTSPPETRSASKKKPRLPPFAHHRENQNGRGGGMALSFSPPDQEANRVREQHEMERKERERAWRVEQARRNGQLLVFSPGGSSSYLEPLPAAASSNGDGEQVASELKSIRETMNKLMEARSNEQDAASAEVLQAEKLAFEAQVLRSEQLSTINTKLESSNQKLQTDVKGLETKLAGEKEHFLIEKTRLEGELDASKRESMTRIQGLEEARKQLADQLHSIQKEKTNLLVRVTELENEVNQGSDKIAELKATMDRLRSESQAERDILQNENQRLSNANQELSTELEQVKKVRDDLERRGAEYEEALDSLENKLLPESESQLRDVRETLRSQKEATAETEEKLKESIDALEKLKSAIDALEQEKEEERVQFQALNEDSSKAFAKMENEASAKDQKIDSLSQQLLDIESELESEKSKSVEASDALSSLKSSMDATVGDLERSLVEMRSQLEVAQNEKEQLQQKFDEAMSQIATLSSAKKDALAEYTSASTNLDEVENSLANERETNKRLQEDGREKQLRIMELEQKLVTRTHERDDALDRMGSFDDREEELYRKLRESDRIRRDLHNRVMQLSGNIRVFVRVRPALQHELEHRVPEVQSKKGGSKKRKHDEIVEEEGPFHFPGVYDRETASAEAKTSHSSADDLCKNLIEVTEPYKDRGGLNPRRKKWRFGFDQVFSPSHGQEDVWEATEPLVQSAIDGFNVCIFAYGQTGSGKTYTMIGGPSNEGIIARSVTKLFETKREMEALSRGETTVSLSVELLEIYNEQVRDLLAPNSGPSGRELPLKVTSKEVIGNIVVATSTKEDVLRVLELAQKRRCVKATMSNAESSRSHMVFTIHFKVETKDGVSRAGKLHICDLAGSERLNKSGAAVTGGTLLTETKNINSSLSVLSNVIERLQAGSTNVPYRESKLTFVLQNSLGGNSKTLAIVCCNPVTSHFHESLCSLRFAEKVNKVDLKAMANFSC